MAIESTNNYEVLKEYNEAPNLDLKITRPLWGGMKFVIIPKDENSSFLGRIYHAIRNKILFCNAQETETTLKSLAAFNNVHVYYGKNDPIQDFALQLLKESYRINSDQPSDHPSILATQLLKNTLTHFNMDKLLGKIKTDITKEQEENFKVFIKNTPGFLDKLTSFVTSIKNSEIQKPSKEEMLQFAKNKIEIENLIKDEYTIQEAIENLLKKHKYLQEQFIATELYRSTTVLNDQSINSQAIKNDICRNSNTITISLEEGEIKKALFAPDPTVFWDSTDNYFNTASEDPRIEEILLNARQNLNTIRESGKLLKAAKFIEAVSKQFEGEHDIFNEYIDESIKKTLTPINILNTIESMKDTKTIKLLRVTNQANQVPLAVPEFFLIELGFLPPSLGDKKTTQTINFINDKIVLTVTQEIVQKIQSKEVLNENNDSYVDFLEYKLQSKHFYDKDLTRCDGAILSITNVDLETIRNPGLRKKVEDALSPMF